MQDYVFHHLPSIMLENIFIELLNEDEYFESIVWDIVRMLSQLSVLSNISEFTVA